MKPTQRKGVPRELFASSIAPASVDAGNRAVDVVLYTCERVQRSGFFSDPYFLTLSLDPAHVRLGRLNNGVPVLDSFCRKTAGFKENSPPRLRRECVAQRRGGGARFHNSDTGLAFPGLFEPPRRGQWLPILIQGGEPNCRVLRQKLDSHSDRSLKGVIGVVEKGWLENGQAVAKLRVSDRAEVEPVWNDIKNGIIH